MFQPEFIGITYEKYVERENIKKKLVSEVNWWPITEVDTTVMPPELQVDWSVPLLSENSIRLLEQHLDEVTWRFPSPTTPKLDTEKMLLNCKEFARELAAYVFHPQRLTKLCESYNIEFEDYFEMV